MASKAKEIVKRSKSNILYVGDERRSVINSKALNIGNQTGIPVQPGDFLQFLIDVFSESAEQEMINQLSEGK